MTNQSGEPLHNVLILPAKPRTWYSGGWAAGSVAASALHCSMKGKTYWFAKIIPSGKNELNEQQLNKLGFFYTLDDKLVLWAFEWSGNLRSLQKSVERNLKKYVPPFRKIYLKGYDMHWLLIEKFWRLKYPLELSEFQNLRGFKSLKKRLRNGAIAQMDLNKLRSKIEVTRENARKSLIEELLDEKALHRLILARLIEEGHTILPELSFKRGRCDIVVLSNDEKRSTVIEVKKHVKDDAISQLKSYIPKVKKYLKKERELDPELSGEICGLNFTKSAYRKTRDEGFTPKIIEIRNLGKLEPKLIALKHV
jgi:hypothetical protein